MKALEILTYDCNTPGCIPMDLSWENREKLSASREIHKNNIWECDSTVFLTLNSMKYIRKLNSKHFSTKSENSSFSTPFWHFKSNSSISGFKIQLRDYSENVNLLYFSHRIRFWCSRNHISSNSWRKLYSGERKYVKIKKNHEIPEKFT